MPSSFEWFIIAVIVVGIIFVGIVQSRRAGQANPVSTGKLEREMRGLAAKVGTLGGNFADLQGDVKALSAKVDQVERESVTASDMDALKELIRARIDPLERSQDHAVQRLDAIYNFLMEKGLGGR